MSCEYSRWDRTIQLNLSKQILTSASISITELSCRRIILLQPVPSIFSVTLDTINCVSQRAPVMVSLSSNDTKLILTNKQYEFFPWMFRNFLKFTLYQPRFFEYLCLSRGNFSHLTQPYHIFLHVIGTSQLQSSLNVRTKKNYNLKNS